MRLLIIGDMGGYMGKAAEIAQKENARITKASTVDEALTNLRLGRGADLIMIDINLPLRSLVKHLKSERIVVPVVACGIGNDAEAAVDAIRAGAKEYLPLPPNAELIAAVLAAVAEEDKSVIAADPAMLQTLALADQIAPSNASILISGESGTGKEVISRYIHQKSKRSEKTFVAVNCAAIPENLLESELFGHEKGAFTGAVARRIGKFEEASKGTILLDEISEMDIRLQAKLLRVIQEQEIDRVGGTKPVKIDVRILATSNRNMEEEVANGRFRQDLYFRLNVVSLHIPPLRLRLADIEPLTIFFIKKYCESNGIAELPISNDALNLLKAHPWPGNVRELENAIQRAVLLTNGNSIESTAIMLQGASPLAGAAMQAAVATQYPYGQPPIQPPQPIAAIPPIPTPPQPIAPAEPIAEPEPTPEATTATLVGQTVAAVERDLIIDTLQHTLGNRTHAATILGISIRTLRNKLRNYTAEGLNVPKPREAAASG